MSSEWFSAKCLLGLDGMSHAVQVINRKAQQESWKSRPRKAKGGGKEYHISSLPKETQRALNIRAAKARSREQLAQGIQAQPDFEKRSETLWKQMEQVPLSMQERAKERLKVLFEYDNLVAGGLTSAEAVEQIRASLGVTRASLFRWRKAVKEAPKIDWLPLLLPEYKRDRELAECTPEAWEFFKADYLRLEKPTAADCYRRMVMAASKHGWTVPGQRTIHSWINKRIPATTRVALRPGTDARFSRQRGRSGKDHGLPHPAAQPTAQQPQRLS